MDVRATIWISKTHMADFCSRLVSNLTLLGCFLSMFCSVGFVNAFGVFQEYYHSTILKSYSNFDINWIGSFTTFIMYLGALPSGYLIDQFGARVSRLTKLSGIGAG